ncbi:unnamed protein product, partial [Owenia fusiformis]
MNYFNTCSDIMYLKADEPCSYAIYRNWVLFLQIYYILSRQIVSPVQITMPDLRSSQNQSAADQYVDAIQQSWKDTISNERDNFNSKRSDFNHHKIVYEQWNDSKQRIAKHFRSSPNSIQLGLLVKTVSNQNEDPVGVGKYEAQGEVSKIHQTQNVPDSIEKCAKTKLLKRIRRSEATTTVAHTTTADATTT